MTDVPALFRLDDRVAIVTGASSGLGDRFVRVLHAAGARVVAAARRTERLMALAESIDDSERFEFVTCDVASNDDCQHLVDEALGRFGRIDVLVNNAGTSGPMAAEVEPPDHFRSLMDVNVNGLFVLSQ